MSAYLYANVQVNDTEAYKEYQQRLPAVLQAHGGRFLVRGGAATLLEGDVVIARQVILEFPDMQHLRAFYDCAEYQALIALRQAASNAHLIAIEGVAAG